MRKRKGLFFFLKILVTILSLARPPGTLKASYTRLTAFIKVNSSQRSTCGTSPAYPLRDSWHISKAFTGTFHFSRLVVMVLTSSHDSYPAFFLSFSTVHLQVGFGLPLLLFSTGAQVMAALPRVAVLVMYYSIYTIISHLRCFTTLLKGFMPALSSGSSVLTCHCSTLFFFVFLSAIVSLVLVYLFRCVFYPSLILVL